MQDTWTSPSGSRWEPVAPPVVREPGPAPRRRYRRPLVAVLLAVLGAGALTTGATYAAQGELPAARTPAGVSPQAAGDGGHDGLRGHDHHGRP